MYVPNAVPVPVPVPERHLFAFIGYVTAHGSQPFKCIEDLCVLSIFGLINYLCGLLQISHAFLRRSGLAGLKAPARTAGSVLQRRVECGQSRRARRPALYWRASVVVNRSPGPCIHHGRDRSVTVGRAAPQFQAQPGDWSSFPKLDQSAPTLCQTCHGHKRLNKIS